MAYRNVIVGTDGSTTAAEAVRQAGELAAASGARLVVVTAYTPGEGPGRNVPEQEVPAELRWVLTDRAQAEELAGLGRQVAREAGATDVVVRAAAGEAAEVLLEAATDHDADLIVVGSRGMSSPARFILGAVASTIAHHAPCDVLVVHTT
jgi:nucleotide-binding universal stress UspA family protein